MTLVRFEPMRDLDHFSNRFQRFFDEFPGFNNFGHNTFSPRIDISENDPRFNSYQDEIEILKRINIELDGPEEDVLIATQDDMQADDNHKKVILPESVGLDTRSGRNEEFYVEGIFY